MDYSEIYLQAPKPNNYLHSNLTGNNNLYLSEFLKNDKTTKYDISLKNYGRNVYSNISLDDIQMIIYTRFIVSSIGSFLCFLCILLYVIIFIKKRCMEKNSYSEDKLFNNNEKLNTTNNKLSEKLLTDKNQSKNISEEIIENEKNYSEINNSDNYFRSSTSLYYVNRLSKLSITNNKNVNKENATETSKILFLLKDELSKVPSISTFDFQRKTANTIANNENRKLLMSSDLNAEAIYSITEPVINGKEKEENLNIRISNIDNLVNSKECNINDSCYNYKITFNENNDNYLKRDELIKSKNCANFLLVNKLKFYENEDLVNSKQDILENIYEKNLIRQEISSGNNIINQTFLNSYKRNKPETIKANSTDNNHIGSYHKEESNLYNNRDSKCSKNLMNYSNFPKNKKEKYCPNENLSQIKITKNSISRSNSDFNSFFDCKENLTKTEINNGLNNKKDYSNTNFISSKKNFIVLAQSDSEEYKKNLKGTSDDDYDNSYVSNYSITNNTKGKIANNKPKILKMGMINDILVMLIFSNLGFLSSTFLVFNTNDLDKNNALCQIQGLIQNYFDLASICWTTVVSNVMKNMIISINVDSEKKKFKWYFSYCLILPLIFCIG